MKIKRPKTKCSSCGCLKHKTIAKLTKNDEYLVRENYCTNCNYLKTTIETKLNSNKGEYVYLTINKRQTTMHRFVYELFHGIKLTPYDTIHHIDCIKSNNIPNNLLLTEHHNPTMHKAHQCVKNEAFKKKIKELEVELEYYKKKVNELSEVRSQLDSKKRRCQDVSEM